MGHRNVRPSLELLEDILAVLGHGTLVVGIGAEDDSGQLEFEAVHLLVDVETGAGLKGVRGRSVDGALPRRHRHTFTAA